MPCTAPSIPLLDAFRPVFTAPTWNKRLTLLRGTLLARGRRTGSSHCDRRLVADWP
jgi:hypothetical protein